MKKLLAWPFIVLALVSCGPPNESVALFQKIEAIFNSGQKSILLSEVTSFSWDQMCLFKISGSYDSIAYTTYQDHLSKKEMEGHVPDNDYGLILVFSEDDKVTHEYYQKSAFLTVNTIPTDIQLASKKSFVKFCSEPQGLKLTYSDEEENTPQIYISREK